MMHDAVTVYFVYRSCRKTNGSLSYIRRLIHIRTLYRHIHSRSFVWFKGNFCLEGILRFQVSFCFNVDFKGSLLIGTVHYAKTCLEAVALGHLIWHNGSYLSGSINFYVCITQTHPVRWCNRKSKNSPPSKVIRKCKLYFSISVFIGMYRRIPVAYKLKYRPHADSRPAVPAGVCALFLKLLPSYKTHKQTVVDKV